MKNGGTAVLSQTFGYDGMSRLNSVASGVVATTYARLPGSNLVSGMSNGVVSVAKTYDDADRLTNITSSFNGQTMSREYTYDLLGRRTRAKSEDNTAWKYTYDSMGQVTAGYKTDDAGRTLPGFVFNYAYDDIGNLKAEKRGGNVFEYFANNLNQYTRRTVPGAVDIMGSAVTDAKIAIQRGSVIEKLPLLNGYFRKTYNLDNSSASVSETFKVYATKFDSTQNKDLLATQTIDIFIPKNPEQFTYDADGNMLSDGRFTYTWDGENRLIKMEQTNSQKIESQYDYMSRRTGKKVYASAALTSHTKFVYDGWNLIAEIDANTNTTQWTYTWGEDLSGTMQGAGGVGGLLSATDATGTYYPVYDGNGNIIRYVDTTGKTVAEYEYNPFGKLISKSGPKADDFHFKFSTKYHDKETGLYYYGYRYYNPETARWINRDPLGEFDTNKKFNTLYGVLGNNPVNKLDYLGREYIPMPGNLEYEYMKKSIEAEARHRREQIKKRLASVNCVLQRMQQHVPDYFKKKQDVMKDGMPYDPELANNKDQALWDVFVSPSIDYYLKEYSNDVTLFQPPPTLQGLPDGMNAPLSPPIISPKAFFNDDILNTLDILVHEPLHDLDQLGFGHDLAGENWQDILYIGLKNAIDRLFKMKATKKCCDKKPNEKEKIDNLWEEIRCDCGVKYKR